MPRLPVLTARQTVRALERCGFALDRVKGSHHKLVHPGPPSRSVAVPVHANRDLPKGTLKAIIEQSGLSVKEFLRAVR